MLPSVGAQRLHVHALTTWKHWAEGHDVPDRTLQAAFAVLAHRPGPEQHLAAALHHHLGNTTADRGRVATHHELTPMPVAPPDLGIERSWGWLRQPYLPGEVPDASFRAHLRYRAKFLGLDAATEVLDVEIAHRRRQMLGTDRDRTEWYDPDAPIEVELTSVLMEWEHRRGGDFVDRLVVACIELRDQLASGLLPSDDTPTLVQPSPRHDVETTKRPRVACRRRHVLSRQQRDRSSSSLASRAVGHRGGGPNEAGDRRRSAGKASSRPEPDAFLSKPVQRSDQGARVPAAAVALCPSSPTAGGSTAQGGWRHPRPRRLSH